MVTLFKSEVEQKRRFVEQWHHEMQLYEAKQRNQEVQQRDSEMKQKEQELLQRELEMLRGRSSDQIVVWLREVEASTGGAVRPELFDRCLGLFRDNCVHRLEDIYVLEEDLTFHELKAYLPKNFARKLSDAALRLIQERSNATNRDLAFIPSSTDERSSTVLQPSGTGDVVGCF